MNHDHSNQSHSWTGCSFTPNLSVSHASRNFGGQRSTWKEKL